MDPMDQFDKKKYLNLETIRRNGQGVRTPVWFVREGACLYVITMAGSGKVKRLQRQAQVNVAACRMDGKVIGSWITAQATLVTDPEVENRVQRLFDRKYGLMKKLFERQRANRAVPDAVLEIRLSS
jgi:uncharacterized protein